jgi:hypothetical protein
MDVFGVRRIVSEPAPTNVEPPPQPHALLHVDPRVVKPSYQLGEILPGGETSTIEFKSCRDRQRPAVGDEGDSSFVLMTIKSKVGRYISAFLNSWGGCILFGVEDDGRVTGFSMNETARMLIVKACDAAVGTIDPQVEVDAVSYHFTPVAGGDAPMAMLLVTVQPGEGRKQPVYYLGSSSIEAWIRRSESLHKMDASLIRQREDDFADATGRKLARTWRHLVLRAIPFEEHTELLLDEQQPAKVARLWLFEKLVSIILNDDHPPTGRLVCVLGQGGSGKSTLMAALCRNGTQKRPEADESGWRYLGVLGCHYCLAGAPQTLSARAFVDGFAASLVLSPYSKGFKQHAIHRPIEVLRAADAADPIVAFRSLLRLCCKLPPRAGQRRVAYVIDGLDEASDHAPDQPQGQPTIAAIVLRCAREAPSWLIFVVSSKSETHAATLGEGGAEGTVQLAFPGASVAMPRSCLFNLDDHASSADDVAEFVTMRVAASEVLQQAFSGEAAAQLSRASGGNFQFARSVLDLAAEQSWRPEQVQQLVALPNGSPPEHSTHQRGSSTERGSHHGASDGVSPQPTGQLERLYVELFSAQFFGRFEEVRAARAGACRPPLLTTPWPRGRYARCSSCCSRQGAT